MTHGFAGGVRDAQGKRGYVPVGDGVAAVELDDGAVLWRREGVGRPIAATASRLLTLDQDGEAFVLRLLDTATGAETGRIERFGMPDWAQEAGTSPDGVQIQASETPAGLLIAWRLRRPYRGGAPPPPFIAAQAGEENIGSVLVDPEHGKVAPTPGPSAVAQMPDASGAPPHLGPHAVSAPDTLALEQVGDRLFVLKAHAGPAGSVRVTLEARDARDGSSLWEAPLAQVKDVRPTPPRPAPPPPQR